MQRTSGPVVFTLACLALLAAATPAPAQITGRAERTFEYDGPPPLLMPTAVAVAADGSLYVADGVNDRVLRFGPDGALVEQIAGVDGERLSCPLGLRLAPDGCLWIADTGNHRILVRAPDGGLVRVLQAAVAADGQPADVSDVAISPDGNVVWYVDNDGAALVRFDLATQTERRFGGYGEGLGQLRYPFQLAIAGSGDVLVTDVINGRVAVFDAGGQPVRAIGTYGVGPGQLYRPKGVACDARGNVWVSDGVLGVIQVFSGGGLFAGVLCDQTGRPLHFEGPTGLAFDGAGNLFVVELRASRVCRVHIDRREAGLPGEQASAADRELRPLSEARPAAPPVGANLQPTVCTACHLEWMRPLDEGRATELISPPPNPRQHPAVSRSETCLSCHDGSVVDSRRRVWLEHGHGTNVTPPPAMTVPRRLPLVDGKIVCRTCHSAHTRGGSGNALKDAVFLRVQREPGELCGACHPGRDADVAAGMHPLGSMPIPTPPALLRHGLDGARGEVTCLSCHTGHGARSRALLAADPDTNALCLACHQELAPPLFGESTRSRHGRLPVLDDTQRAIAEALGARVGPGGVLLCVTCHRSHGAVSRRYLLASDRLQHDACADCHAAQRQVVGSAHDLRTSHPQARNVIGVTAAEGGPCSPCHTAHRFGRPTHASTLDDRGRCVTCHDTGQIAQSRQLDAPNHPGSVCGVCHDPHAARFGNFLAAQPSDRCVQCHPEHGALVGGPHDVRRGGEAWPGAARATNDVCLACHRPHGTKDTGLFRLAWKEGPAAPDAGCLPCHADAAPTGDTALALAHPRRPTGRDHVPTLPLGRTADGQPAIACKTCHEAHSAAADGERRLLRIEPGAVSEGLCLQCHHEMANITMTGHAAETLRAAGFQTGGCRPCHAVHAARASIEARVMWPKVLSAESDASSRTAPADRYCVACHRAGGPVSPPAVATHPPVEMLNLAQPGAPGHLPLFNDAGQIDPRGSIGCRTCHLLHGRSTPAPLPNGLEPLSPRELRARVWHIRSFGADSVCTTCHGFDGLRRFLYFHDPVRRSAPANRDSNGGPAPAGSRHPG